ncbi:hypothetical protein [Streptomyces olivoreticuli]|uniref:hypothetical protein n=1 Tax=Streptomyces olivoreticuli TaxID=68246 RepID=UPI000E28138B|nr:hypothetical protein [Streptomyces olivoreticuli]
MSDARIRLASAGGDSGTHKASQKPWTTAGGVAGELHEDMKSALTDLEHAHDGIKSGTTGFASASALSGILGGWGDRLGAVRDECHGLDGTLKTVGTKFGENDVKVQELFDATKSKIDAYSQPKQGH